MTVAITAPVSRLRRAAQVLRRWTPIVHGTQCPVCHYEVPALGLSPDAEMAWFERFEGRPCPACTGLAVGVVAGLVAIVVHSRPDGARVPLAH